MVSVPAFLLRRLYVKKSLKNTPDGFEFHLRNQLGSGYSHGVHPITVDGVELPIDVSEFDLDGDVISFSEVSRDRTLTLALNKTMVVRVHGTRLDPGPRKIGMGFDVPGLGSLEFDFTDVVEDD